VVQSSSGFSARNYLNPDLTVFRDHGGKAILWHGWADQLITLEGTIDCYKRVQEQMGGRRSLGGHPKPAIGGHLKSGQRDS
jgi:hypothetical protein